MKLPFVARAVLEERDYLRGEVARLAQENRDLTNALMTNARLVPAFADRTGRKVASVMPPRRRSIEMIARELEAKERA